MAEHVLVALDGSEQARRALENALDEHPGARVSTLHVIDPVDSIYAAELAGLAAAEGWVEDAEAYAEQVHETARSLAADRGREVEAVTEFGRPVRQILAYADEHGVDAIVLGSHGRTGLERVALGSVAEGVVRRATVPVTVVH